MVLEMGLVCTLLLLAGLLTGLQFLPPRDEKLVARSGYLGLTSLLFATLLFDMSCPIWITCTYLLGLLLTFAVVVLILGALILSVVFAFVPQQPNPSTSEQSTSRLHGIAGFAAWIFVVWLYMQWWLAHPAEELEAAFQATLLPLSWLVDFDKLPEEQYCPGCLPHAMRWSALAFFVMAASVPVIAFYHHQLNKRLVAPVQASERNRA